LRQAVLRLFAEWVRHLAGPNGSYITGQAIPVNGGGYLA